MIAFSVIGYVLSVLWLAKKEPPVIMFLSWFALIYAGVAALFAADD